ncbi:WASH complex subunit 1 [Onthophagus taurus]|uniref:WASH complex subunit 1 n=1 Tax=Onthophagus taurus TaxID=166361 RepID=UPI0039BDA688
MSVYNVPVIPLNLRKEETIIQIAESFNYLSDVSNDIFKRISSRIEKDAEHLNQLNGRIDKVNLKISKLSGAKKAIQVFSSSKYPAADLNQPYKTLFDNENIPTKQTFPLKYKDEPVNDDQLETLQFYHLNFVDNQKPNYEGLGEIPKNNIENVNDVLLYNSGTNLYNKYIIADALKILQRTKKEVVSDGPEIGAAPLSISEPTTVNKHTGENYFYSPHLGDVPTIDVPIDLPDLPGIADDLRYTDNSDRTIAPSVITSPNIPELPEIITTPNKSEQIQPNIQIDPPTNSKLEPKIETKIEPKIISQIESKPIESTPKETEPTPTSLETSLETALESSLINELPIIETPSKPVIPDMHATLMDAIRKAGGMKKLKATEPRKNEDEVKKKPSGGDLMADLHSKLLMRRKGISGAEKANGIEPGSAMDRISAMLPPPPVKSEQSESGTTDDDWED